VIEEQVPGALPRFELSEWRKRYGVVAGITGRGAGETPFDLGLAGTVTPVGQVIGRWLSLRGAVPDCEGVVVSRQVHGTEVLWHQRLSGLVIRDGADGHATDTPGVLLAVTAADCVPVYLLDPVGRRAALLHAGWRGTAARILSRGIALLKDRGSRVEDLLIHCGVGICGACYEVSSEVIAGCGLAAPPGGKGLLDLREVLVEQARGEGVENVSTSPLCSAHDSRLFFSHRRSGGADGRMVAYLGLPA
jgi:purine-nucleoside/S-methyl-5'-thioadenosine phosphorylase / adenosine deaminase